MSNLSWTPGGTEQSQEHRESAFGWTVLYQQAFRRQLLLHAAQWTVPDNSYLYARTHKTTPTINGFAAWNAISSHPLYQHLRHDERKLLSQLDEQTVQAIKAASCIIDYGCWSSEITIHTLKTLLAQGKISAEEIVRKKYVVYDVNWPANETALRNFQEFLENLRRQYDIIENYHVEWWTWSRNHSRQEKLFTGMPDPIFVFALGCTYGNLSTESRKNFFDITVDRETHILFSYFSAGNDEMQPFQQMLYGNHSQENVQLPDWTHASPEHIENFHALLRHQCHSTLLAWWFPEELIEQVQITSYTPPDAPYDIYMWWQRTGDASLSVHIAGETFDIKPNTFYPLLRSPRLYTANVQKDTAKFGEHISSNTSAFTVYELIRLYPKVQENMQLPASGVEMLVVYLREKLRKVFGND